METRPNKPSRAKALIVGAIVFLVVLFTLFNAVIAAAAGGVVAWLIQKKANAAYQQQLAEYEAYSKAVAPLDQSKRDQRKKLIQAFQSGDASAAYELWHDYAFSGNSFNINEKEADQCFDLAVNGGHIKDIAGLTGIWKEKYDLRELAVKAENGDADIAYRLWRDYAFGENGAIQDDEKAERYLVMAADNGHVEAMGQVGRMYTSRGSFWTIRAEKYLLGYVENSAPEDSGHVHAEYLLGVFYFNEWQDNRGNEYTYQKASEYKMKAYMWLNRAKKHGSEEAEVLIATHF